MPAWDCSSLASQGLTSQACILLTANQSSCYLSKGRGGRAHASAPHVGAQLLDDGAYTGHVPRALQEVAPDGLAGVLFRQQQHHAD